MGRIRVLPETVQNKIAAGEVVERPASVVKELVENSIDAGATSITVEIEDGGHRLIRVTDDGCGMDEEDLVASMQRHATSKISSADDIFAIKSFGFRGEALPSVGSVSRMSIHTAVHGQPSGHELRVEGGELIRIAPAQSRRGTRIEVRDIFYNTPARRKFLRSGAAEATQTLAVMTRLALGNPGLAFRLQNGDKITLAVEPKTSQMERIRDIFGTDLAEKMLPFARNVNDQLSSDGFVARPPESNRNSSFIYLLVNNRWIRSFGLFRALADAFQGAIQPRHYPKAVVNITVNPERIDVNVHPAKEEIRFDDERALIGGIKQAIREALGMAGGTTTFHAVAAATPAAKPKPPGTVDKSQLPDRGQPDLGFKSNLAGNKQDLSKLDLKKARDYIRRSGEKADGSNAAAPEPPPAGSYDDGGLTASMPRHDAASESDRAAYPETETISPFSTEPIPGAPLQSSSAASERIGSPGTHRILGQAGGKYIIVDGPDGLLLVDPHALHERWNYDRLRASRGRAESSRTLLLPLRLSLSQLEAAAADEAVAELEQFGFVFSRPDSATLVVKAIPTFLSAEKTETLLRQVLSDACEAGQSAATAVETARDKLLASLACRSSVLLGRTLPQEEMLAIMDSFFNAGQLPTCPHGRPTAIRLSWTELDRRFMR